MAQRCDNCAFHRQQSCKRFPPVIMEGRAKGHQYPPVQFDDWCGEWQPSQETIEELLKEEGLI